MDHKRIAMKLAKSKAWNSFVDYFYRWVGIAFVVCLGLMAILKAIDLSITNSWGLWQCALAAVVVLRSNYNFRKIECFKQNVLKYGN